MNEGWFPLQFSLEVLGNCQTSSDHFITCALHSRNVQFSLEGGREGGGAEIPRSVRKFWEQKVEREEWMLVCCSKPEMTFLEDQSRDKQELI